MAEHERRRSSDEELRAKHAEVMLYQKIGVKQNQRILSELSKIRTEGAAGSVKHAELVGKHNKLDGEVRLYRKIGAWIAIALGLPHLFK